jgi:hypothetical protein
MIVHGLLTDGNALKRAMEYGASPLIWKLMVFVVPGLAFALAMAQRNEPGPLSAVLVTVNVDWASPTRHRKANAISVADNHPRRHIGQNRN